LLSVISAVQSAIAQISQTFFAHVTEIIKFVKVRPEDDESKHWAHPIDSKDRIFRSELCGKLLCPIVQTYEFFSKVKQLPILGKGLSLD
jgi:hypothetical protein